MAADDFPARCRGTRDDLNRVKVHSPPKLVEQGKKLPFIVISPQCPRNQRWNDDALTALLIMPARNCTWIPADCISRPEYGRVGHGVWA